MDDLISRAAAIDALRSLDAELRPSAIDAILNMLNGLPSVQPEPKTGWDAISRSAAIEEVCNMMRECFGADDEMLDALKTTLNELTAIYPERKTGAVDIRRG